MARTRRYLNNLPNIARIKDLAHDILDYELKLDQAQQERSRVKNEILALETKLIAMERGEYSPKREKTRMKLNNFADDLVATDKIIKDLKRNISDSKSMVNDEIREGLSKIYKKAKLERDEGLKDLIRHQNLADEAHNKFANSSPEEYSQYHHQWISNVQRVIEDEERIERSEKELEAIKRVYRLEFG